MDDLINEFIAETREMLQALCEQVVAWEAAPHDRARLDGIFRFVHTVKGNSGFFDLPRIEALSHAAETVLADLRSGVRNADSALVSAVLAVIDRIGALVEAIESGETVEGGDEQLIAALAGEAAGPAGTAGAAGELRKGVRSVRLSVELLDRIMNGISDAVLARNELARRMREFPCDVSVEAAFEQVSASTAEIRDAIMRTRMQRVDALFAPLPRMVRDLSAELGKRIALEVDGGEVELDRELIETIRDPLTHIIRNAVDHGSETADERAEAGKPAAGTLRVSARQAGNQILIEVADDGRGVDGDALVRHALAAGLLRREAADRLSPSQKTALIFEPGLSTAPEVTAVSGRGVGMDVVRSNIERIGGLVEIESRKGQGLRLVLRVPLTLTIIPALTVGSAGQCYAIPRAAIDEIVRVNSALVRIETVGGSDMVRIRGRRMPMVRLSRLLGSNVSRDASEQTLVLLKPGGGHVYALAVDRVHDHEELVVKPASPGVMAAGLYAGTTLADDGRPILLLDPAGLAACAGVDLAQPDEAAASPDPESVAVRPEVPMILFNALDGSRRAVRLALVERIEDVPVSAIAKTGGRLRVAIGEGIVPLAGCPAEMSGDKLRVLRLTDGSAEIAYGFAHVIDIVSTDAMIQPAAAPGEIGGVALIEGEQTEILDPLWLFATHGGGPVTGPKPVCALPLDDPWMENMLRPMIESLGYAVVSSEESDRFDLLILGDDRPAPAGACSEVIRIRSRPEPAGRKDDSIYRYDRAGLLSALSSRAAAASKGRANG